MVVLGKGDEVVRAKVIVERAEKARTKKDRKAFCQEVATKQREILKVCAAQKRLRKELCRDVRINTKTWSKTQKASYCVP